jgi:hypothetical protein
MKRITTILSAAILLAIPSIIPAQQNLAIAKVATPDVSANGAPPHVVTSLDTSEYRALIKLAVDSGRTSGKGNIREYDFIDSLGYTHNVYVTFRPEDVSWKNGRAMQIDVFVSGSATFTYAVAERGTVAYDCRCSSSVSPELRNRFDSAIVSAIKQMVALGKRK